MLLVDELDQAPEPATHDFQHRDSHVLPPLVGLYVLDERHLVPHHRDGSYFLKQSGDLLDPIAQPGEAGLVPQEAELQAQREQVESLGLLVLRVQP